jgi:SAM-dependent methyltransferase
MTRDGVDGSDVAIVPGFRAAVLAARPSGTPNEAWRDEQYAEVAHRRVRGARQRMAEISAALGARPVAGLEIGCGAGVDAVVAALEGTRPVVGIDRDLPLADTGDRGLRARRLLEAVLAVTGRVGAVGEILGELGVDLRTCDAAALPLPAASVDAVWSRAALEHVRPLDAALRETARVLRPGGIAHHLIDPYFWLKGCHAGGLTDVPWAHARLSETGYRRAVERAEGVGRADRRTAFLRKLNPLGLTGWRSAIDAVEAFEVLSWEERHSPLAERLLAEHPDVETSLLPGVTRGDLTCCAIVVVLRRSISVRSTAPGV